MGSQQIVVGEVTHCPDRSSPRRWRRCICPACSSPPGPADQLEEGGVHSAGAEAVHHVGLDASLFSRRPFLYSGISQRASSAFGGADDLVASHDLAASVRHVSDGAAIRYSQYGCRPPPARGCNLHVQNGLTRPKSSPANMSEDGVRVLGRISPTPYSLRLQQLYGGAGDVRRCRLR